MQSRDRMCTLFVLILLLVSGAPAQLAIQEEPLPLQEAFQPSLQFTPRESQKSVLLAIGASLLLPGLGEYYAGNFDASGKYALTAEGAIWVTYTAFRLHGTWLKDDARAFAADRAGVSFDGKDGQFEVDLGNFMTVDEYNQAKLRNRQTNLVYSDPAYVWSWSSDADRTSFKDQRIRGDRILDISKFVVAAAVVNRVISAFSAGRAASAHNRAVRVRFSFRMDYVPELGLPRTVGAQLQLSYRF